MICDRFKIAAVAATLVVLAGAGSGGAADPAVSCETGKLKVAGKYASCRLNADAKAVKTAATPDYSKCIATYGTKWATAQSKGDGMCPGGQADETPIRVFIDECDSAVAAALAGGDLLIGVETCNADLATCTEDLDTCEADLAVCDALPDSQLLVTGQTDCWATGGGSVPCIGSAQDGEFQNGVARSFTNNGNGTITDNATGLMWEVLSDDGSIHDLDNNYTWANAFAVKVATLNTDLFAGHNDWRVPNRFELDSLVNLGASLPAVHPAFDTACAPGCANTVCSCTDNSFAWTSTTFASAHSNAWIIDFDDGDTGAQPKSSSFKVRAVRGGQ